MYAVVRKATVIGLEGFHPAFVLSFCCHPLEGALEALHCGVHAGVLRYDPRRWEQSQVIAQCFHEVADAAALLVVPFKLFQLSIDFRPDINDGVLHHQSGHL